VVVLRNWALFPAPEQERRRPKGRTRPSEASRQSDAVTQKRLRAGAGGGQFTPRPDYSGGGRALLSPPNHRGSFPKSHWRRWSQERGRFAFSCFGAGSLYPSSRSATCPKSKHARKAWLSAELVPTSPLRRDVTTGSLHDRLAPVRTSRPFCSDASASAVALRVPFGPLTRTDEPAQPGRAAGAIPAGAHHRPPAGRAAACRPGWRRGPAARRGCASRRHSIELRQAQAVDDVGPVRVERLSCRRAETNQTFYYPRRSK
jgi:hypothetical protein